jgi:signal transduction histidine kinase
MMVIMITCRKSGKSGLHGYVIAARWNILVPRRCSVEAAALPQGPSSDEAWVQKREQQLRADTAATMRRGHSVGWHLAAFAIALALPFLIFSGVLLWNFAVQERARLEAGALDDARDIAVAVDREITGMVAALQVLALSSALHDRNLQGFHAELVKLHDRMGISAVLRDAGGQQLLNSRLPWGAALPRSALPLPDPAGFTDARVAVTDLFIGTVAGVPLFAVQTLVPNPAGGPPDLLSLGLPVERLRTTLRDPGRPVGWTASVVDNHGIIMARNIGHDSFMGRPATRDMQEARGREVTWTGTTVDGRSVFGAFARSELSGWRAAVGVPLDELAAPLRRSMWLLGGLGAGLAALSLALATFFAGRIANPLRQLTAAAAALGRGEAVQPLMSPVREATAVGITLAAAAGALREREDELRRLNAALEHRVHERTAALETANAQLVAAAAEREQTEAQLRQSQKMEAVGRLTGGVAHDFNNLLTVVLGNLALARRRLGDADERVARAIDNAAEGGRRAAELTQRLLAFSRQQPLAPVAVEANRLVAGMSNLLRSTLGEDVQIETVLAAGLWRAIADANQLEGTLLNLAVNARDAMPGGGRLTIETANAYLDEAYSAGREDVTAGQYVMISVSDTGSGMPPEVLARAFEPFFTTKPVGQGTGLGLSHVYGFAKQSGGHAAIYSETGHGTTVKVYLPRLRSPLAGAPPEIEEPAESAPGRVGASETILVTEDEQLVREFATVALEEAGWRVLAAEDGPSALALLDAHPEVALLFTDVVLTGPLNGRALADEALKRRPELPVLFTTGYTRNAIIHHGRLDEGVNFLGKPYAASALTARVSSLLGRALPPCDEAQQDDLASR